MFKTESRPQGTQQPLDGRAPPAQMSINRPTPADPMVAFVRSVMRLVPTDRASRTDAVTVGRAFQSRIATLDAEGWIAWCRVGLAVFALPSEGPAKDPNRPWVPSLRVASGESRRLVLVLAMLRYGGNITHVARALGTSRRSAREQLKAAGLYPWDRVVGEPADGQDDASCDGDMREVDHDEADGEVHGENGGTHVL